ncbi:phosphoribosylamine--glycine ligase [Alkalithermobacter thermoalcaliphilus JW-YL-7 = DSM 7308]|uniref:Phosphoribosylamine--glycine ligase n=1 Tax=Alkalithermobacter thermoalcaliphilus JW-YL-7 = DSM 7308 TaxID=1121328 RepID=A0A150FNC6_CLOPD|nr:Phosphoribosylamine--glycine ligase [[Clostridium] paradoxum JW-YL-7 = DSM 7308]SHK90997.1 phosphoribosylamine--glycine ligase [[Clostridium] paradoxum JW-YL-7 = DSM 7308]
MKVLIIGSGGREHAIAFKFSKDKRVSKIYCAPGNAGTAKIAENVDIAFDDIKLLLDFAKSNNIDLTIVGPEKPLVMGIVDEFQKHNLKIFGPNKYSANLEGSKAFAKEFMIRNNIPTARYKEFESIDEAKLNVDIYGYPVVIKADGLANGKGVIIAKDRQNALESIDKIMLNKEFGKAGDKIIIEEFLEGIETSILAFVDGKTIVPMESAQDYKRAFDNDKGENTGGMGAYSPSLIYNSKIQDQIKTQILDKIIDGFNKENIDYKGILFIGIIVTKDGPKVLEFNVRFGDPETQVLLPRLNTSLIDIIESILDSKLDKINIDWIKSPCVSVVLASKGYPKSYEIDKKIYGLLDIDKDIIVFHSGTKTDGKDIFTNGGRVLCVTSIGKDIKEARDKVYENIKKIDFEGKFFRTDIGKVISL